MSVSCLSGNMTALSPRIGGEKELRMSKKGRRSYNVEEKVSVLREHLVEGNVANPFHLSVQLTGKLGPPKVLPADYFPDP
jgi:hypothetical protein